MKDIVVVGAGKIGSMIAELLAGSGDYAVTVVDRAQTQLDRLETRRPSRRRRWTSPQGDAPAQAAHRQVRGAERGPLSRHPADRRSRQGGGRPLPRPDRGCGQHARREAAASDAQTAFIPQCGLAPGFITIVASDLASHFDELHDVRMRVGALPKFPSNALNYNLTWSTDGVINEYCEPCEAIVNGQLRETPAAGRARGVLARRRALRGLQHLGRSRHALRDAGGQGAQPQLPHHPLSRVTRPS